MLHFRTLVGPLLFPTVAIIMGASSCVDKPEAESVPANFDENQSITESITDSIMEATESEEVISSPELEDDPIPVPTWNVLVSEADFTELVSFTDEADAIEIAVDIETPDRGYQGCILELHGGYARKRPKKSFRIRFPDEDKLRFRRFNADFAEEEHRRVVLQASWVDPTHLRNATAFRIHRQLGGIAPRTTHLWLTVNGHDYGLYTAIERIDRIFLERNELQKDGNVYKAINHWANLEAKSDPMKGYEQKVNEDNPTDDIGVLLDALSDTPANEDDFAANIAPLFDIDGFMAYGMTHVFAGNRDAFTKNYYLHHDLTAAAGTDADRFRIISWDSDATFGQNWNGNALDPLDDDGRWYGKDRFSPRLYSIDSYRSAYLDRFAACLDVDGPCDAEGVVAFVDDTAETLAPFLALDLQLWERDLDATVELERFKAAVIARQERMAELIDGLTNDTEED